MVAWSEIFVLFSSHSQVQELGFKCSCVCRNHRDFLSLPSKVLCWNWVLQTLGFAKFTASFSSCIIFDRKESHFWLRICSVMELWKLYIRKRKKQEFLEISIVIFEGLTLILCTLKLHSSIFPNLNLKLPHHGFLYVLKLDDHTHACRYWNVTISMSSSSQLQLVVTETH